MKNLLVAFLALLAFTSCEQDNLDFEMDTLNRNKGLEVTSKNNATVSICHKKGGILTVGMASLDAHLAHGEAVDMDGDGFFDRENDCSPIDCDDTTFSEDNTCGPVVWSNLHKEYSSSYANLYVFTEDNFNTLSVSSNLHVNATTNYDLYQIRCVTNAPRLSDNGTVSTYDGGIYGTMTLTLVSENQYSKTYTFSVSSVVKPVVTNYVRLYNWPLLDSDCLRLIADPYNEEE